MIQELERQITALEVLVRQMVRTGVVTSVVADRGMVRVRFPDNGKLVSNPLPVLFSRTQKNKAYDLPEVGEQVVCLFLPSGMEQGYVIGCPYSSKDKVPVTDPDKLHYAFGDKSFFEYDRKTHKLILDIQGDVELTAKTVSVEASQTKFKGDLDVAGNISATGSILDGGGNSNNHAH